MMKSDPGTYTLILRSQGSHAIQVGRFARIQIEFGYYLYVGSAFGPGGVKARVSRHCRKEKPKRWHIDYVRESMQPVEAWYSHAKQRLEHRWARILLEMKGSSAVKAFGCSDCRCHSHLFHTSKAPDFTAFAQRSGGADRWCCKER